MSECPIHRTALTLGRCWMCRGVPPGAASRSEQSAATPPFETLRSPRADPAAEAAQSPQEGAALRAAKIVLEQVRDAYAPQGTNLPRALELIDAALAEPGRSVSDRPPASESPGPLAALLREALPHLERRARDYPDNDPQRPIRVLIASIRAALRESSAERGGEER